MQNKIIKQKTRILAKSLSPGLLLTDLQVQITNAIRVNVTILLYTKFLCKKEKKNKENEIFSSFNFILFYDLSVNRIL